MAIVILKKQRLFQVSIKKLGCMALSEVETARL